MSNSSHRSGLRSGPVGIALSAFAIVATVLMLVASAEVADAATLPQTSTHVDTRYDLTGDGLVSQADVMEATFAWEAARASGKCDALVSDVTDDGCVTISDIQAVAARLGGRTANAVVRSLAPDAVVAPQAALTFVVNSTSDGADSTPGNGICRTSSGVCSLRAAMQEANLNTGPDTINFGISGTGPHEIRISNPLPSINDQTGGTTINGYSQSGARENTDPLLFNGVIKIQIVGPYTDSNRRGIDAIRLSSSDNVIRGLSVVRMRRALWIGGAQADDNVIAGNIVGLYANGNEWISRGEAEGYGIYVNYGGKSNRLGGTSPADRNVVSGNSNDGIAMTNDGTWYNLILGNNIGMDPFNGDDRDRNWSDGVDLNYGAAYNIIGGLAPGARNWIAGNASEGVELSHAPSTAYNEVIGNYVGTNVTGTGGSAANHRNPGFGVSLEDRASNNKVGPGNVISNNGRGGMEMYGNGSAGNQIFGNRIGVNINNQPLPNTGWGIRLRYHGSYATIGPDNIIAHNTGDGILLYDPNVDFNTITRNSIYGNGGLGIDIEPDGVNQNGQYSYTGANQRQNFPVIATATTQIVTGTACAGCVVELFVSDSGIGGYGEGRTFVAAGTADAARNFSIPVTGVNAGQYITSTATAANRNTSEFSLNKIVSQGAAPPTIPGTLQLEDYRVGGEGVGYHDTTVGNNGGVYRAEDVDIQTCTDPTTPSGSTCYGIGWITDGEWLAYNVTVPTAGWYTFALRTASPGGSNTFRIELDGTDITGSVPVVETDSYQVWADSMSPAVQIPSGNHELKVWFDTGNYNANYLRTAAATPPNDAPPTVAIDYPVAGTVSGVVPVTIAANDDRPGVSVAVSIDGGAWWPAIYSPASALWELLWDARDLSGNHNIVARSTDSSSQTATSDPVSVTIDAGGPAGVVALAGRIDAEDYRAGGAGVAYHDETAGNTGTKYRTDDVDIQSCTDATSAAPCYNIAWIRTNEWLGYTVDATGGNYTFAARVASANDGRRFHVEIDGQNVSGPIAVPNTGGAQVWTTVTTGPIAVSAGLHTLRIVADTNSFNLNYLEVGR